MVLIVDAIDGCGPSNKMCSPSYRQRRHLDDSISAVNITGVLPTVHYKQDKALHFRGGRVFCIQVVQRLEVLR